MTSSTLGYVGQVPTSTTVMPFRGTLPCGHYFSVVATVLDQNGIPIKNLPVHFVITSSPSTHDKLKPSSDKTNKYGQAKSFIKYACTVGDRVITATAGDISASAVVHIKLRRHHHHDDEDHDEHHERDDASRLVAAAAVLAIDADSLPKTSTVAADTSTDSAPDLTIATFIALVAAATIIARRLFLIRR